MSLGIIFDSLVESSDYLAMDIMSSMPINFDELYLQLRIQVKIKRITILYWL